MTIRLATPKDEPAMIDVCADAFFEEHLFGPTIHPYRHEYPEDVKIFWHEWVRAEWKNPRNIILVSTVLENEKEHIVGIAVWQRQGEDEGGLKIASEWVDVGPDAFTTLPSMHNRALEPSRRNILQDSSPYFAHHWNVTTNSIPRKQNWFLDLCCVHPKYAGRGLGRELVQWGLRKAKEEHIHASVIASHNNDDFYLRCGFDEMIGNCCVGEGNPLGIAKAKGGNILFKWAELQPGHEEAMPM